MNGEAFGIRMLGQLGTSYGYRDVALFSPIRAYAASLIGALPIPPAACSLCDSKHPRVTFNWPQSLTWKLPTLPTSLLSCFEYYLTLKVVFCFGLEVL